MGHQLRSIRERVVHAIGFEIIAVAICSPVVAYALDRPLANTGLLSVMMSTIATLWNLAYNWIFDRHVPLEGRTLGVRVAHAIGFEAGLVLTCVPLAAWWLSITLVQAVVVEAAFLLFILPYTVAYNGLFDRVTGRTATGGRRGIPVSFQDHQR